MRIKILLEVLFFVIFFVLVFIENYLLKMKFTVWLAGVNGGLTAVIHIFIKNKIYKKFLN